MTIEINITNKITYKVKLLRIEFQINNSNYSFIYFVHQIQIYKQQQNYYLTREINF